MTEGSKEAPVLTTSSPAEPQEILVQQRVSGDYLILKYAVIGLIITIGVSLAGSLYLASQSKDIPEGILAIGSTSVGALATMLVRPPGSDRYR